MLLLSAFAFLSACGNFSVYPFFQEEDIVTMDQLLGTWEEMESRDSLPLSYYKTIDSLGVIDSLEEDFDFSHELNQLKLNVWEPDSIYKPSDNKWIWIVETDTRYGYIARHTNYTEIFTYYVQPFELYGNIYLDIFPGGREEYDETYASHFIRTHSLVRIRFRKGYAFVEYLDIKASDAGLKMLYPDLKENERETSDSTKINQPTKNIIIDNTVQIQQALKPYLVQDTCWIKHLTLRKK